MKKQSVSTRPVSRCCECEEGLRVDFFANFYKIGKEFLMKNICKTLVTLFVTTSAFLIGFYLGKEKIIAKIPNFQSETEDTQ
jgi:hypothetical protein